jgi:decaprenylphospho-beta-D-erythro-pentofuranosid-2-ulose 2-reductase
VRIVRVLVLGGSSEIAEAIVRRLAARESCEALLAGRDEVALRERAERLKQDGCASVRTLALEARATDEHAAVLQQAFALLGDVDLVILAVGVLGKREQPLQDIPAALEVLEVNFLDGGSLLLHSAKALSGQGHGAIVVLSSVAAERARASNVIYCASKAGLDSLAQGLADALHGGGVKVLVVRPGFVRTRMTKGLPVPPFATSSEAVAKATLRGLEKGSQTVWAPPVLRFVMALLGLLPRALFRRLPL